LGLWVSLWDESGRPLPGFAAPNSFWQLLQQTSDRFQKRLSCLARQTLLGKPGQCELEPHSGLQVICLPIVHRQHGVGSILACALTPAFLDPETIARFCSLHQLDRLICERLISHLPSHSETTLDAYAQILRTQADQLGGQTQASRDIHNLSSHLAQAYEELNLIYRISSNLTVLKRPAIHFDEVCRELLEVSVVQAFAAVLETADAGPEMVCVGPIEVDADCIIKLYDSLRQMPPNAGAALAINDIPADPNLSWAGDWLHQLVFFRLARHDKSYGGLVAINHAKGHEFGSQEIQLMNAVAERSTAFLENARLYEDLEQLFMGMLHALVSSIDAKDTYTRGHSQRVAWLSRHLAERLEMSEEACRRVYLSGLLHDVGKIGIPEHVLRKSGSLTGAEFEKMKRHPEIGARILQSVKQMHDIIPGVLEHHERFDGQGYPSGLKGDQISIQGRITGLADSFDAMTSSRAYRTAHPLQIAIAEIRRWSGTQFDPHLVDLFLQDDPRRLLKVMGDSDKQALARYSGFVSPPAMGGRG
jgi:HD-GYP domain-containing protein (c-di-GMP phosphodiesterase class II)